MACSGTTSIARSRSRGSVRQAAESVTTASDMPHTLSASRALTGKAPRLLSRAGRQ